MHVKTSGGIAGGAFLLSFLIGLIGGAGFPMLLVRAPVFALVSFVLSEVIHLVVERFLIYSPVAAGEEALPAGSHVDISVEDASSAEPSETVAILDIAASDGTEVAEAAAKTSAEFETASDEFLDKASLVGVLPINGALDEDAKNVHAETADGVASGADFAGELAADSPAGDSAAFGAMETLFPNTAMPLKDVKLPDMESTSDAFVEKKKELFEPPTWKQTGKSSEALGKNYDPAKVANAIKTLLQQK
ncbi:MAG: hypothetical protein LBD58_09340 [Treponema sp.]|jgi:hypothetical protein|nr:hypothetical protein [Treponema sp.]